MNSTQSDMLLFLPSLSLSTAQPGRVPSSTKLKTPIWFKYRTTCKQRRHVFYSALHLLIWVNSARPRQFTSNSVGEITSRPSYLPLHSVKLEINLGSCTSTSLSTSCTTLHTSLIVFATVPIRVCTLSP